MAYRCHECLYDVNTWCGKYEDGEYCCQGCERLSDEGRCKCLMRDINDCPDFVPKIDIVNEFRHTFEEDY